MGNPLLDISANVPKEFLDKYGVAPSSAILAEAQHQPLYGDLVQNYDVQYIAGGATQNSCRVAQWMLTAAGMPDQVAFMGCVGQDDYGKQLETCASADGVLVNYMKDTSAPTGTCAALIVDKERSLVTNLDAANNFKETHLQEAVSQEIIDSASIYYSAGFFLTVSVESLEHVASKYVEAGKTVCVNLSAPFIIDFFSEQLSTALSYADYVFGNESEAATYAKKHGLPEDDLKQVALAIAALPSKSKNKRTAVITQGSECTYVAYDGVVKEYAVVPLEDSALVDTNGAGDAFVGGFLAQLCQGKSVDEAVAAGHWAARHIIQVSGTTLSGACQYKCLETATA